MVHYYDAIPPFLSEWAMEQQVFFTASAPLTGQHVNISPRGLPATTLHIFDANHIAYIDATGSGVETIAHIYENGRVTLMFCSFDKAPRIMRWFCKGSIVEWDQPEFEELLKKMGKTAFDGARAILLMNVWKGRMCSMRKILRQGNLTLSSRDLVRLRSTDGIYLDRSRKDPGRATSVSRGSKDPRALGWQSN